MKKVSKKTLKFFEKVDIRNPIREIQYEEIVKNPKKGEEYLENVLYAGHAYRIKSKDGKSVMMLPLRRKRKMVTVTLELDDLVIKEIQRQAKQRDVTFDQMINILISRHFEV